MMILERGKNIFYSYDSAGNTRYHV